MLQKKVQIILFLSQFALNVFRALSMNNSHIKYVNYISKIYIRATFVACRTARSCTVCYRFILFPFKLMIPMFPFTLLRLVRIHIHLCWAAILRPFALKPH